MASKKLKPFITYLEEEDHQRLKKFAKLKKLTMAKVIREGVLMRLAADSPYLKGYNEGVLRSMTVVKDHPASQMRFPSGQSFSELICDDLCKQYMQEAVQ
jgi:hypothetical protein